MYSSLTRLVMKTNGSAKTPAVTQAMVRYSTGRGGNRGLCGRDWVIGKGRKVHLKLY